VGRAAAEAAAASAAGGKEEAGWVEEGLGEAEEKGEVGSAAAGMAEVGSAAAGKAAEDQEVADSVGNSGEAGGRASWRPAGLGPAHGYCSARHRVSFNSRNQGSESQMPS